MIFPQLQAQNIVGLDSLNKKLKRTSNPAQRADLLYQLSEGWAEASFDSAYHYASTIIGSYSGNNRQLMKGYRALGLAYDYQYQGDSALKYYEKSLGLARELKDSLFMGFVNFNLGTLKLLTGNYLQVLPYYDQALELLEGRGGGGLFLSKIYTNLGIVYRRTKRYEDALQLYRKAAVLLKQEGEIHALGELYVNKGNAFGALKSFDSARLCYEEAIRLAEKTGDKYTLYYASNGLGIIRFEQNRLEEALPYFNPVASDDGLADKNLRITALGYLGSIHQKLGQLQKAEAYFEQASTYIDEAGFPDQTMEYYLQLADFYEKKGDPAKALEYFRLHNRLGQALLTKEVIDRTSEWEERFQNQEKEKEIIALELRNEEASVYAQQQANQRNLFLFLAIILTVVALFSFYLYLLRKRSSELLSRKNSIIEQALADKELLMKEIHHRVKNNLQVISSLLNLQTNFLKDTAANAAVLESKNRVHAMALIHQTLYHDNNLAVIDAEQYLEQLIGNLEQSYNSPGKNIIVETCLDPLRIDVDKMILLGLIVNELLTNAYKYAFDGLNEGIIEVQLKQQEDKILFTMKDNGIGMKMKVNATGGLGMMLIRDFAKKLGSAVEFSSAGGTQVQLVLEQTKMVQA